MNFEYIIYVHSRASECRKEGAYACLIEHHGTQQIIRSRIVGTSLTSVRAHLIGVISALLHTPGHKESILIVSHLEAFVCPFGSTSLFQKVMTGRIPNADLWGQIIHLCLSRDTQAVSASIKANPRNQLRLVRKLSLEAFHSIDMPVYVDDIAEPRLF